MLIIITTAIIIIVIIIIIIIKKSELGNFYSSLKKILANFVNNHLISHF